MAKRKINCPSCGRSVEYTTIREIPTFPFCSDRCRWADLDRWLEGEYRIATPVADSGEGEEGVAAPKEARRDEKRPD